MECGVQQRQDCRSLSVGSADSWRAWDLTSVDASGEALALESPQHMLSPNPEETLMQPL